MRYEGGHDMRPRNNFGRELVRRFNILELERVVPNRKPRVSPKKKYSCLLTHVEKSIVPSVSGPLDYPKLWNSKGIDVSLKQRHS
jgi:hypothetical protein